MQRPQAVIVVMISLAIGGGGIRAVGYQSVAEIRAQFAALGPLLEERVAGRPVGVPGHKRDPDAEIRFELSQTPKGLVLQAVDEAIRSGTRQERTGAFETYWPRVSTKEFQLDWAYHPILLDLLSQDDLKFPAYTGQLCTVLSFYPTRETALAFMAVADRTTDRKVHDDFIHMTAGFLGIYLQIDSTKPAQNEKLLSEFHEWFERNKDRIQFDKKGSFRLTRGEVPAVQRKLGPQDRKRIRQDPSCVLRLFANGLSGSGEADTETLGKTCGAALLGPAGADLLKKVSTGKDATKPTEVELQGAIASARNTYPLYDAAALAAVYVLTYDADSKSRDLAKQIIDQLGAVDLKGITKGEPREVRNKARELWNEVLAPSSSSSPASRPGG